MLWKKQLRKQSRRILFWTHYRTLLQAHDPKARAWYERKLETSIISNLQKFLIELGKGYLLFTATRKKLGVMFK